MFVGSRARRAPKAGGVGGGWQRGLSWGGHGEAMDPTHTMDSSGRRWHPAPWGQGGVGEPWGRTG